MENLTRRLTSNAPRPLLVAAVVVALQGLVSFGFGVAEALHITGSRATMGVTTALFFVAFGAALVLCAWGLTQVNSSARGPVLISQLISLGMAWSFRGDGTWLVSAGFALPAVVVLVAMLRPESISALEDGPPADG